MEKKSAYYRRTGNVGFRCEHTQEVQQLWTRSCWALQTPQKTQKEEVIYFKEIGPYPCSESPECIHYTFGCSPPDFDMKIFDPKRIWQRWAMCCDKHSKELKNPLLGIAEIEVEL